MKSRSISHIRNCYGCGVCAISCPNNLIKIELNKEGFYEPVLFNESACTQCGACLSVCAYNDEKLLDSNGESAKVYAAWSNNIMVRKKCTSGGIGFELAMLMIKQGYKACGVRYNPALNRAEHFMVSTINEFIPSIGSKYIQSYTLSGFSQLSYADKYFITGTPCQIDSLRRYVRKRKIEKNFVLMDFFCHGVPSMNMWKKYTEMVGKQVGKITYASWRNKITGWHDSVVIGIDGEVEKGYEKIDGSDNFELLIKQKIDYNYLSYCKNGDLFYEFFLGDNCLGRACYDKCKYKCNNSAADIRIGDFWGNKYKHDDVGVSSLIGFTDKGKDIVSQLDNCTLIKEDLSEVLEIQQKVPPMKNICIRKCMLKAFTFNISIKNIYNLYQIYLLPEKVFNKLLRVMKFT